LEKEIKSAKKVLQDAWDVLDDFFEEKRSDIVIEKEEKAKKGKIALVKFSKGMIGKTNQINFRILIGQKKEYGDYLYEAVYMNDKKEPYIYIFKMEDPKSIHHVLTDFKEENWNGYKKVKKYKSLTDFLEIAYKKGIYCDGKKEKNEDALNIILKKGLKRSLEAIEADSKEKYGIDSEKVKRVAKVVAIATATTVVSAALTPAAGVVVAEVIDGAPLTGELTGQATQAALEGVKNLADPVNIAKKIAQKAISKGKDLGKD
jgi:hypothetical protein